MSVCQSILEGFNHSNIVFPQRQGHSVFGQINMRKMGSEFLGEMTNGFRQTVRIFSWTIGVFSGDSLQEVKISFDGME